MDDLLAFQQQDSLQTLGAGLEEYYAHHPELLRTPISAEAQQFFGCHDAVHVVFGCGTALDDEAAVKIASLFGTTAGLRVLRGYASTESRAIYAELEAADVLRSIAHSVIVVPRTIALCLRQRRRWPWAGYREYLDVPLADLRREFGIRVVHTGR
jgi:hypothetical protein